MSRPPLTASSPGPREPLSRDRIVAAAVAVLDAEGMAGLTMRRVARELDAGAMSLYRHVTSREQLLDLVLETLAAEIPISPLTGAWRADAAAVARDIRAALLRRRDLTLLLTARLGQGPAALASLDRALGIFLRAGFTPREAVRANHGLGAYVAGSCTWEAVGLGGSANPEERSARAAEAARGMAAAVQDSHPNVAAAADELFAGTADDRFEFGLAALLDGYANRLAGTGGAPTDSPPDDVGGGS